MRNSKRVHAGQVFIWCALAVAFSDSIGAPSPSVQLDGDFGCDTLQTQRDRMSALKVAMQTSMMKAQGNASPAMLDLNRLATAKFAELSRERCRALSGKFKVLERQSIEGGSVWRVQATSAEALWVLMK